MQRGVLLHKGQAQATEVSVPQPPADHTKIEPAAFRCVSEGRWVALAASTLVRTPKAKRGCKPAIEATRSSTQQ